MKVLFDISRMAWSAHRVSPSGIDRVVTAYGQWLEDSPDFEVVPVSYAGGRLSPVSRRRFRHLLAHSRSPSRPGVKAQAAWDALSRALQAGAAGRAPVRLPAIANDPHKLGKAFEELASHWRRGVILPRPAGDIYLNVAHAGMERPSFLGGLAQRGIANVVMIHDLIPLTHPEYCTVVTQQRHARRVAAILEHGRLVITNSQTTAQTLKDYAASMGKTPPAIVAAPLGLEPQFLGRKTWAPAAAPYFVCVGTIEARKNLSFLMAVWRRLAEEMGADTPQLVLVGLRGWENEAVLDYLERSDVIRPFVHEASGLHDDHLAQLLAGSRGLLAPSFVEGFDLPLMEALSLGVPAIASDIAAHRELARGAKLVDPLDGLGWVRAIEAACTPGAPPASAAGPAWTAHFSKIERELKALRA